VIGAGRWGNSFAVRGSRFSVREALGDWRWALGGIRSWFADRMVCG
jgi:hypothetical protein